MSDDTPITPTTLPADQNPIDTLLTMARFLADEGKRGIAEIRGGHGEVIGYALLTGHPEADSLPVFDAATRVIEWGPLRDWLKARGYEASGCRWNRAGAGYAPEKNRKITFTLTTPRDAIPPLPAADLEQEVAAAQLAAQYHAAKAAAGRAPAAPNIAGGVGGGIGNLIGGIFGGHNR